MGAAQYVQLGQLLLEAGVTNYAVLRMLHIEYEAYIQPTAVHMQHAVGIMHRMMSCVSYESCLACPVHLFIMSCTSDRE